MVLPLQFLPKQREMVSLLHPKLQSHLISAMKNAYINGNIIFSGMKFPLVQFLVCFISGVPDKLMLVMEP